MEPTLDHSIFGKLNSPKVEVLPEWPGPYEMDYTVLVPAADGVSAFKNVLDGVKLPPKVRPDLTPIIPFKRQIVLNEAPDFPCMIDVEPKMDDLVFPELVEADLLPEEPKAIFKEAPAFPIAPRVAVLDPFEL